MDQVCLPEKSEPTEQELDVRKERCTKYLLELLKDVPSRYVKYQNENTCWLTLGCSRYLIIHAEGRSNIDETKPPVFRMMTYEDWEEVPDEDLGYLEPKEVVGYSDAVLEISRVLASQSDEIPFADESEALIESDNIVRLESQDGHTISCPHEIAMMIPAVKDLLELCEDEDPGPLPLQVPKNTLKQVIEYLSRHTKDPVDPTEDKELYPPGEVVIHPKCDIKERNIAVLENAHLIRLWHTDETNPTACADMAWIETKSHVDVYELMMAANYLEIRGLLNLTTFIYHLKTEKTTPEERARRFGQPMDKTDKELEVDPRVLPWDL